jgi:hypothetical protein
LESRTPAAWRPGGGRHLLLPDKEQGGSADFTQALDQGRHPRLLLGRVPHRRLELEREALRLTHALTHHRVPTPCGHGTIDPHPQVRLDRGVANEVPSSGPPHLHEDKIAAIPVLEALAAQR